MSKNQLIIQLSENFCSLAELSSGKLKILDSILFREKKDFQYKETLKLFFDKNITSSVEYDEISVSWITPNALLTPANIFSPSEIESLFSACFNKTVSKAELDYNRMMESSLVTIYEIPLWVKSFFIMRFPRIVIQHEYSHTLRGILKQNSANSNIQVSIFPEEMILTMINKNEIILCNSYEINHLNDIIYYLTFAMQQEKLTDSKGLINFSINSLSNINELELNENLLKLNLFSSTTNRITFDADTSLKHQQFCV